MYKLTKQLQQRTIRTTLKYNKQFQFFKTIYTEFTQNQTILPLHYVEVTYWHFGNSVYISIILTVAIFFISEVSGTDCIYFYV